MATPKQLSQNQLTASFVTQYTAPAGGTILTELAILNTSTTTVRQVSVSVVPNAGAASDANAILKTLDIQPLELKLIQLATVIAASGFLSAKASAATDITLTCSGVDLP